MARLYSLVIIGLSVLASASAEAQFVRVGPLGGVSIRGPRGSVDVLPFGLGTRVQTPGASLNTGLFGIVPPPPVYHYGYAAPVVVYRPRIVYEIPVVAVPVIMEPIGVAPAPQYFAPSSSYDSTPWQPGSEPISQLPVFDSSPPIDANAIITTSYSEPDPFTEPASPRDKLRSAAVRLRDSLSMRHLDADIWLNYLNPDRIIVAIDANEPPGSLAELLRNYEGMAGSDGLNHIWSIDGFWQTHESLRAWVASAPSIELVGEDVITAEPREATLPSRDLGHSVLDGEAEEIAEGVAEELPAPK